MIPFLIILFCLSMNAVFAAVEMAFVTADKPRLRQLAKDGNIHARRILALRKNPERTLSILQIGISVVGAVAAAVGGVGAVGTLGPWFVKYFSFGKNTAEVLALFAVVLPLTYFNVVASELVPKSLALRNPLAIALRAAPWLALFDRVLSPIVSLLEDSTRLVLRLFRRRVIATASTNISGESGDNGDAVELDLLSNQTREYVLNLVELEHRRIADVSHPWNQVISVRKTDSENDVERTVLNSGHTRLPVLEGDSESIAGIINTKEFMVLRATDGGDWRTLIRPVVRVDETSSILRALRLMQERHSHLSITYRNGIRTGIVTIEDILEEVIGDLYDEDDDGIYRRLFAANAKVRARARRLPLYSPRDL
jgi:putative hemolysin